MNLEESSSLRERLDQAATRLALEPAAAAADWPLFLDGLRALAEAQSQPQIAALVEQLTAEKRPPDPADLQAQLELLQEAVSGGDPNQGSGVESWQAALADDPELISDFVVEARGHISSIERLMLALEQNPGDAETLNATFRAFHTVKGLAGFLNLSPIRDLAHEVETILDNARNGRQAVTASLVDAVLESTDCLVRQVAAVESRLSGANQWPDAAPAGLLARLRSLAAGEDPPPPPADAATGREEPPAVPAGPAAKTSEPARSGAASPGGGGTSIKVDTIKLDYLVDMLGELVIAQSLVNHNTDGKLATNSSLMRSLAQLTRITNDVQKTAMSLRMVPVDGLFQRMKRLVRDIARKSGKLVDTELSGNDTELDRNIVEELADPLMHMVRNAVDHGIEPPSERAAAAKTPQARVRLHAEHQSGSIVISISDDGRGIRREKILKKARERGLVDGPGEHLSDNDVFQLIFEPGFSTAEQVTDLSGRGVGMDVVKKQIQKLRGRIDIESVAGQGTVFTLKVPLTLAIIDGLIVGAGEDRYIIPIFAVKEILRPAEGMLSTMENRAEIALIRGRVLPVVRLRRRFGLGASSEDGLLVVAEARGKEFCLMVDSLLGKQEVVIKSLGETFRHVAGVAGGAILGDGRVGLILDMNGIFSPDMAA
jgi:two-component system chemotaxis sensor kinase CheA